MPYPSIDREGKHDLVALTLPPRPESLLEKYGLRDEEALFAKLSKGVPGGMKLLAKVYSFNDGLRPPFRNALFIVGYIPLTHSVVRTLIAGQEEHGTWDDSVLHPCTVAVKRGDGAHEGQLRDPDSHRNSIVFAEFVRRLRKEKIAAVMGQDRHNRTAILKPVGNSNASHYHEDDFHLRCYVGKTEEIKDALSKLESQHEGLGIMPRSPPPPPGGFDDNGPVWEKPEAGSISLPSKRQGVYPEDEPVFVPYDANSSRVSNVDEYIPPYTSGSGTKKADSWLPTSPGSNGHRAQSASSEQWDAVAIVAPKRPRLDGNSPDNEAGDGEHFHANEQARRTEAFYETVDRSEETGPDSQIYHMRKFNNWVKALQMQEVDPRTKNNQTGGLRILDLACGKGADLTKWIKHRRGIGNYVGIDVTRGSLVHAAERARNIKRLQSIPCTFSCADLGADVPGQGKELLTWSLQNESDVERLDKPVLKKRAGGGIKRNELFDVVSVQFAIHYFMQTKERARRFFKTVSHLLDEGGNLIVTTTDARVIGSHLMNLGLDLHFDGTSDTSFLQDRVEISVGEGACRLSFEPEIVKRLFGNVQDKGLHESRFGLEYSFQLIDGSDREAGVGDAVNLEEWMTPIPLLVDLAAEVGLELVTAENFHEFYQRRSDPFSHSEAHQLLSVMNVLNRKGTISPAEWEISRLYVAVTFRKVPRGASVKIDPALRSNRHLPDDEDEVQIDPAFRAKNMLHAMKAAKEAMGSDWGDLSQERKTELTEIQLKVLAKNAQS